MATADAARANGPIMLAAVDRPSDIGMAGYGMSGQPAARHGLWMRAHGLWQDYDGDRDMAGSKLSGGALTIGADTRLKNDWVVGVSFSAGRTNLEFDGIDDDGYARGRAIGAYAGFTSGAWTYRGHLAYAWYDNRMEREVVVGALRNTAKSDFDSHSILVHGEASVDLPMGGWTLQPLFGVQVLHARSEGFTEKGAGGLNLKVDADSSTSVRTLIGVRELVEEALAREAVPAGVAVDQRLGKEQVHVDVGQVCDAIANVIRNACEAMNGHGTLTIASRLEGDSVELTLADTGVGISQEELTLLFEPLVTSKALGMGLGLTTARALVINQGGSLECEGERDKGARFKLRLPVATSAAEREVVGGGEGQQRPSRAPE